MEESIYVKLFSSSFWSVKHTNASQTCVWLRCMFSYKCTLYISLIKNTEKNIKLQPFFFGLPIWLDWILKNSMAVRSTTWEKGPNSTGRGSTRRRSSWCQRSGGGPPSCWWRSSLSPAWWSSSRSKLPQRRKAWRRWWRRWSTWGGGRGSIGRPWPDGQMAINGHFDQ